MTGKQPNKNSGDANDPKEKQKDEPKKATVPAVRSSSRTAADDIPSTSGTQPRRIPALRSSLRTPEDDIPSTSGTQTRRTPAVGDETQSTSRKRAGSESGDGTDKRKKKEDAPTLSMDDLMNMSETSAEDAWAKMSPPSRAVLVDQVKGFVLKSNRTARLVDLLFEEAGLNVQSQMGENPAQDPQMPQSSTQAPQTGQASAQASQMGKNTNQVQEPSQLSNSADDLDVIPSLVLRLAPRSPLDDIPSSSRTQAREVSAGGNTSSQSMERVNKKQNLSQILDRQREQSPAQVPQVEPTPAHVPQVEATPAEVPQVEPTPAEIPQVQPTPAHVPQVEATPAQVPQVEPTPAQVPQVEPTPAEIPQVEPTLAQVSQVNPTSAQIPQTGELSIEVQQSASVPNDPEESDVIPSLVLRLAPRSPLDDIPSTSGTQAREVSAGGDTSARIDALTHNMERLIRSNRRLEEAIAPKLFDESGKTASISEVEAEDSFEHLTKEDLNLKLKLVRMEPDVKDAEINLNNSIGANRFSAMLGRNPVFDDAIINQNRSRYQAICGERDGHRTQLRSSRRDFAEKCGLENEALRAFIDANSLPSCFEYFKKQYGAKFAAKDVGGNPSTDADPDAPNDDNENAENSDNNDD